MPEDGENLERSGEWNGVEYVEWIGVKSRMEWIGGSIGGVVWRWWMGEYKRSYKNKQNHKSSLSLLSLLSLLSSLSSSSLSLLETNYWNKIKIKIKIKIEIEIKIKKRKQKWQRQRNLGLEAIVFRFSLCFSS